MLFTNFVNRFFNEICGDHSGEFVCRYWELKGKTGESERFLIWDTMIKVSSFFNGPACR